jgi:hypothetical protein
MYLKVNKQVHTGSLILARIYWRHGMDLVAPSIPFKVGLSDVDHLVADVVPAYAAICTLALPRGFTLPFCILLRLFTCRYYSRVGSGILDLIVAL